MVEVCGFNSWYCDSRSGWENFLDNQPQSTIEAEDSDNQSQQAIQTEDSNNQPLATTKTETKISDTEYKFEVVTVNDKGEEVKREENKAQYFTENLESNIALEMVAIPGGTFIMGSPENEKGRSDDESRQHQVTVPAFYMGKFPITQSQWKAVAKVPQISRELKDNPSCFKGDNLPVERGSWYDAVEFCQRLSKATGKEYRLPSEAEWEYACRAVNSDRLSVNSDRLTVEEWNEKYHQPFYFGETITSKLANYNGNDTYANEPKGEYRAKTTPVGSFPPNNFGLYDMHGNVWEWCADTWHDNYEGAPTDGSAWVTEASSINVLRGGSWFNYPWYCRCANRNRFAPDIILNNIGFRLVFPRTT